MLMFRDLPDYRNQGYQDINIGVLKLIDKYNISISYQTVLSITWPMFSYIFSACVMNL